MPAIVLMSMVHVSLCQAIVNTVRRGQIEQPARIIVPGRPFFFRNHDESYHEFFTAGADAFRLKLPPGQRSKRTTVRQPGLIRVFCSLHPDEVNQLHVARAAYQTAVRDGRFEFTDVRPGGYRLYVLKNGAALPPKTIQVSRGQSEHWITTGPR